MSAARCTGSISFGRQMCGYGGMQAEGRLDRQTEADGQTGTWPTLVAGGVMSVVAKSVQFAARCWVHQHAMHSAKLFAECRPCTHCIKASPGCLSLISSLVQ
jgi:hypothetical protein